MVERSRFTKRLLNVHLKSFSSCKHTQVIPKALNPSAIIWKLREQTFPSWQLDFWYLNYTLPFPNEPSTRYTALHLFHSVIIEESSPPSLTLKFAPLPPFVGGSAQCRKCSAHSCPTREKERRLTEKFKVSRNDHSLIQWISISNSNPVSHFSCQLKSCRTWYLKNWYESYFIFVVCSVLRSNLLKDKSVCDICQP